MSYLKDFQQQIENNDFSKMMQLWEEYCSSDTVDVQEFVDILKIVKKSDMANRFGPFVEAALPLWKTLTDEEASYKLLRVLIDTQTTNTPLLADTALEALKKRYGNDPLFNERIRLVGLRNKENFQGAISNYDLLAHLKKGNFVFHTGGWGTGEIIDVSAIREQIVLEFENVRGRKDISYENAFKTLIPLPNEHFLARRFADPDKLEKEARDNPLEVMKMMLRDLGPKNAAEIKDELSELVIPEDEWTKWWQSARAKLKKDTMIESPENPKEPFVLRKSEVSHAERFQKAMTNVSNVDEIIQTTYNYARDVPDMLKNKEMKASLEKKLVDMLSLSISPVQQFQLNILLENHFGHQEAGKNVKNTIQKTENLEELINNIDIIAFKKRALVATKEYRTDWPELFLSLIFSVPQAPLRDYILKELSQGATLPLLKAKLQELMNHPEQNPEAFVWYFQKVVNSEDVPFANKEGQCQFFESFLILFNNLENRPEYRDLLKKMYQQLSGKRYALVRSIIENTSLEFIKEFLLLASKCQSLTSHDMKILRSLAEVVHPSLNNKKANTFDHNVIWTTEEGYLRTQDKIRHIGTIEIVENAREIEAARALGDLRENSEYKFALERRSRLQSELKALSDLFNRARIITKDDIHREEVGIGSIVETIDPQGKKTIYTILGPWDADADKNILSFQSKLAQAMIGTKAGDSFRFKDEDYKVESLRSFLDK